MHYKDYFQKLARDLEFDRLLKEEGKPPYDVNEIIPIPAREVFLTNINLLGPLDFVEMGSQYFDSCMVVNKKHEVVAGYVKKDQFYQSETGECIPEYYAFNIPESFFKPDKVTMVKDIDTLEKISVILHNNSNVPSDLLSDKSSDKKHTSFEI